MRNPIGELTQLARRFRREVPWDSDRAAFIYTPLLAMLTAIGAGLAVAGSFWHLAPSWRFPPWALSALVLPAFTGFYLTYLHDLLQVRLGWRVLEVLLQSLFALAVFTSVGATPWGVVSGLASVATVWVVAIRIGSDLLCFRPDRLQTAQLLQGTALLARHHAHLILVLCIAAGVFSRFQSGLVTRPVTLVTALGAALCVGAALTQMSWACFVVERSRWQHDEAMVSDRLAPTWWRRSWHATFGISLVGVLLPANLSPLARLSFDTLFYQMNARVAPFFVREAVADSRAPSELAGRIAEGLDASRPSGLGYTLGSFVLMLVLVVTVLRIIKRLLSIMGAGTQERMGTWERERGLWRWLWESLLDWWRRMTGLLLEGREGSGSHGMTLTFRRRQGSLDRRAPTRAPSEPRASIRFLYARFLERAAARGWIRQADETAGEFGERLSEELSPSGVQAVAGLTDVYESVRYGASAADASLVGIFRGHLTVAFRQLRRSQDTASVSQTLQAATRHKP